MGLLDKFKRGLRKTTQLLKTDIRDLFKTEIEQRAKARAAELESVGGSPYRRAYARMQQVADLVTALAPGPDIVARTVVSAVESSRPRQRYLVGVDALGIAVTNPLVPRQVSDKLLRLVADLRR